MADWQKTLLLASATVRQTVQTIDQGGLQIALIVDDQKRLLGTVTDGDVRRGILKGISLDDSVTRVMNTHPLTAGTDEDYEHILRTMKVKEIHHIPIVDDQKRVIGIHVLDDLIPNGTRENWVVIMAGGLGTRLLPLTNDHPKPLLKVGNKPILENILQNFIEHGFQRFYFSVNYKAEMIRDYFGDGSPWGATIRYLQEDRKMGTAGALTMLPERPQHPFVVMNADLLTKVNFHHLLNFHSQNKAMATMCVRQYDFQVPYGVVRIERTRLVGVDEKPVHRFFVNAGIYVLEPEVLSHLPSSLPLDMTEVFDILVKKQHPTLVFPIREYWLDIGQLSDFDKAQEELGGDTP